MKTKKLIPLLAILFIAVFSSCSTLQLKGSYPTSQYYTETSLSQEEVWTNIIDFFATSGFPITTIDKSSGLIVSSKVSFINCYTREKDGKPMDPNAFVVIPTVRGGFGNILEPTSKITGKWEMVGDWNVRIKSSNGKTQIYVNLMNMDCYYSTSSLYGVRESKIPIKSTGVFERGMIELFKN